VKTLLELKKMCSYLLLECSLPGIKIWSPSIKDECIPLIPDAPSPDHENLHEKRIRKISLGYNQLFIKIPFFPNNAQSKPSRDDRWAFKEQMLTGFLNVILTKHTTVTFF